MPGPPPQTAPAPDAPGTTLLLLATFAEWALGATSVIFASDKLGYFPKVLP